MPRFLPEVPTLTSPVSDGRLPLSRNGELVPDGAQQIRAPRSQPGAVRRVTGCAWTTEPRWFTCWVKTI